MGELNIYKLGEGQGYGERKIQCCCLKIYTDHRQIHYCYGMNYVYSICYIGRIKR